VFSTPEDVKQELSNRMRSLAFPEGVYGMGHCLIVFGISNKSETTLTISPLSTLTIS